MTALNNIELDSKWLGTQGFNEALAIQNTYFEGLKKSTKNFGCVFGLEHRSVITLGKRGNLDIDVIKCTDSIEEIEVIEIDRGGQATLHSPGQLVVYPIISLPRLNLGVKQYVSMLEQATILSLGRLGIDSFCGAQAGVFTLKGKIAFVGVRVRYGITTHGISINLNNNLELFKSIRSCGVCEARFDQIAAYRGDISLETYFGIWLEEFNRLLEASSKLLSMQKKAGRSDLGSVH